MYFNKCKECTCYQLITKSQHSRRRWSLYTTSIFVGGPFSIAMSLARVFHAPSVPRLHRICSLEWGWRGGRDSMTLSDVYNPSPWHDLALQLHLSFSLWIITQKNFDPFHHDFSLRVSWFFRMADSAMTSCCLVAPLVIDPRRIPISRFVSPLFYCHNS
jgi:hypothetical protein